MIKVRVKISAVGSTDQDAVGPINNFLHSMFSQVDVSFNQKLVSPPNNAYAYRAYIETLLNYGRDAKNGHLQNSLWSKDTAGLFNVPRGGAKATNEEAIIVFNHGMEERARMIVGEKVVELMGHIHCDVFNQDKFLLNGVDMRLRFVRAKDSFCLIDATQKNFKVKLVDACLLVRRAKLNPAVLLGHAKSPSKTTAKYPLTRVEVKSFVLHRGTTGETIDNAILGQLPKRVILGFVDNAAFNGNKDKNPFDFQNWGINFLSLYVDGVQVPGRPLMPNFDSDCHLDAESHNTLFSGTGIHFADHGMDISRGEYRDGYCLFAFDLTPDLSANCATHWNLVKTGSLRIEVQFDSATKTNLNCILYAEYDNILEIDSTRQIIVDYNS
uniref:Uncharacterized protein n=1 Tax=Bracon brevicornis TaxID=1563983 RepID=A0A6V7J919_9HYME